MGAVFSDLESIVDNVVKLGVDLTAVIDSIPKTVGGGAGASITQAQLEYVRKRLRIKAKDSTGSGSVTIYDSSNDCADSKSEQEIPAVDGDEWEPNSFEEGLHVFNQVLMFGTFAHNFKPIKNSTPAQEVDQIKTALKNLSHTEFKARYGYDYNAGVTPTGSTVNCNYDDAMLVIDYAPDNPNWSLFTQTLTTTLEAQAGLQNVDKIAAAITTVCQSQYTAGEVGGAFSGTQAGGTVYVTNWAAHFAEGVNANGAAAIFVGYSLSQFMDLPLTSISLVDPYNIVNQTGLAITITTTSGDTKPIADKSSLLNINRYITGMSYNKANYHRTLGNWAKGTFVVSPGAGGLTLNAINIQSNIIVIFTRADNSRANGRVFPQVSPKNQYRALGHHTDASNSTSPPKFEPISLIIVVSGMTVIGIIQAIKGHKAKLSADLSRFKFDIQINQSALVPGSSDSCADGLTEPELRVDVVPEIGFSSSKQVAAVQLNSVLSNEHVFGGHSFTVKAQ